MWQQRDSNPQPLGFESCCCHLKCFEQFKFLDIQATIECRFTLKRVRDMTRTYSICPFLFFKKLCFLKRLCCLEKLCFLKSFFKKQKRSKQVVSTFVSLYFGRPPLGRTIKTNFITLQIVDPELRSILIFHKKF